MAQPIQTSLTGARLGTPTPQKLTSPSAGTSVPQTMRPPMQLNANAVNNQVQSLQSQSTPAAAAVNTAAKNPNNTFYAKGGPVMPPHVDPSNVSKVDPKDLAVMTKALQGEVALKNQKPEVTPPKAQPAAPVATANTPKPDYLGNYLGDRASMEGSKPTGGDDSNRYNAQGIPMAKGGPVNKNPVHNMSLKDALAAVQNHPELMGNKAGSAGSGMKSMDMKKGGAVKMPTGNKGAAEASSMGKGLLSMNDDVGTYAEGGEVLGNNDGMSAAKSPEDKGLLKMATGGGLEGDLESDNITGYAPDGTPLIQNADGSQQEGDVNSLLGRPESASTLGTGATPTSSTSNATGNSIGNATSTQAPMTMAKGGADGPPPGSNSDEIADDIPAKLSGGEFVFSADVVRYYGLQHLTAMMDQARDALSKMDADGGIKHPGDADMSSDNGTGHFLQDSKPNPDTYDNDAPQKSTGILSKAEGGVVGEEQSLAKGGMAYGKDQYPVGTDNLVSSHPHAGSAAPDVGYNKGGIVSSTSKSLFPKPSESTIPGIKASTIKTPKAPKLAKGGLLANKNVNMNRDINTRQPIVGS